MSRFPFAKAQIFSYAEVCWRLQNFLTGISHIDLTAIMLLHFYTVVHCLAIPVSFVNTYSKQPLSRIYDVCLGRICGVCSWINLKIYHNLFKLDIYVIFQLVNVLKNFPIGLISILHSTSGTSKFMVRRSSTWSSYKWWRECCYPMFQWLYTYTWWTMDMW